MGHWYDCMGYGSGQSSGASATLDSWCLSEEIQAGNRRLRCFLVSFSEVTSVPF